MAQGLNPVPPPDPHPAPRGTAFHQLVSIRGNPQRGDSCALKCRAACGKPACGQTIGVVSWTSEPKFSSNPSDSHLEVHARGQSRNLEFMDVRYPNGLKTHRLYLRVSGAGLIGRLSLCRGNPPTDANQALVAIRPSSIMVSQKSVNSSSSNVLISEPRAS